MFTTFLPSFSTVRFIGTFVALPIVKGSLTSRCNRLAFALQKPDTTAELQFYRSSQAKEISSSSRSAKILRSYSYALNQLEAKWPKQAHRIERIAQHAAVLAWSYIWIGRFPRLYTDLLKRIDDFVSLPALSVPWVLDPALAVFSLQVVKAGTQECGYDTEKMQNLSSSARSWGVTLGKFAFFSLLVLNIPKRSWMGFVVLPIQSVFVYLLFTGAGPRTKKQGSDQSELHTFAYLTARLGTNDRERWPEAIQRLAELARSTNNARLKSQADVLMQFKTLEYGALVASEENGTTVRNGAEGNEYDLDPVEGAAQDPPTTEERQERQEMWNRLPRETQILIRRITPNTQKKLFDYSGFDLLFDCAGYKKYGMRPDAGSHLADPLIREAIFSQKDRFLTHCMLKRDYYEEYLPTEGSFSLLEAYLEDIRNLSVWPTFPSIAPWEADGKKLSAELFCSAQAFFQVLSIKP